MLGSKTKPHVRVGLAPHGSGYTGVYTYNRTSQRLQAAKTDNPSSEWISVRMLDAIVPQRLFDRAEEILSSRIGKNFKALYGSRWTRVDLLAHLRTIWEKHGRITNDLINTAPGPSARAVIGRFGTLHNAYLAVGYTDFDRRRFPVYKFSREQLLDGLQRVLNRRGYLSAELIDDEPSLPSAQVYRDRFGGLIQAYHAVGWSQPLSLNWLGAVRRAQALRLLKIQ